ncbi:MAG: C39 family peptidase [Anaerolineae bacterium]|nr:C39 family peptidase [Anaerolineae bacterium]
MQSSKQPQQVQPQPPARSRNFLKWGLALTGIGMLSCSVLVALLLIVTPVVFRNLSEADQQRLARRIPILRDLLPTQEVPASVVLPTAEGTDPAAALLLVPTIQPSATVTEIVTIAPTFTPIPPTQTANPPTLTFTSLPPTVTITETPLPPTATTSDATSVQIAALSTNTVTPVITATPIPSLTASNTAIPPTQTPLPTETPLPTLTPVPPTFTPFPPSQTPSLPTLIPTGTDAPVPASFRLTGLKWEPQLWNNCGPANLLQVLRYNQWRTDQTTVATYLKPEQNDKNVGPWEMAGYVNSQTTLRAIVRQAGSVNLLKRLISNGFSVIIESGFYEPDEPDEGWLGHYLTLIGYDDSAGVMIQLDTLEGVTTDDYRTLDDLWQDFNRIYLVVYDPAREADLYSILGADADETFNIRAAVDLARSEATTNPDDPYAWFNLGTGLTLLKDYSNAAIAYDKAFSFGVLPHRHTWYQFGFYEAYYNTQRYDLVLSLADYNIETTKQNEEEPFFWRGMVYAAQGRTAEAVIEFNTALKFNRNFTRAAAMLEKVQSGQFIAPGEAQG